MVYNFEIADILVVQLQQLLPKSDDQVLRLSRKLEYHRGHLLSIVVIQCCVKLIQYIEGSGVASLKGDHNHESDNCLLTARERRPALQFLVFKGNQEVDAPIFFIFF